MKNQEWAEDYKLDRRLYLFNLAKNSFNHNDISKKVGGVLIYNQIIEQSLKEIIYCSVNYIKAEIYPSIIEMKVNLEKSTFGQLIEQFNQYAIIEPNRKIIEEYLKKLNIERNKVVHKLFEIKCIDKLENDLDAYSNLAFEVVMLLNEYYAQISLRLYDLAERVNFSSLSEEECKL